MSKLIANSTSIEGILRIRHRFKKVGNLFTISRIVYHLGLLEIGISVPNDSQLEGIPVLSLI